MRVLLMISNSNMAARELYGTMLRERHPGWGISNMSGLPAHPGAIIKSFDVLIYELGAADDPRRYQAVLSLLDEMEAYSRGHTRLITHVEGPFRDGIVAELEGRGVICVGSPFGPESIGEALARAGPPPRQHRPAGDTKPGLGARLGGLFRRKET